jgi:hypothetical protein
MGDVIEFRLPPPLKRQKKPRAKSQYELYPMPFFDRASRCTWNVQPTGDYTADCATGRAFALEFLKSCDSTFGWASLLAQISADMICAGLAEQSATGRPKVNGIVIGFMSTIARALLQARGMCEYLKHETIWSHLADRAARVE